jgi:Ca-activated chloride channel homolog
MKKTLALFGLALTLLLTAVLFGLRHRHTERPVDIVDVEPAPIPTQPMMPVGQWKARIGDRVTMEASLANPNVLAGSPSTVSLLMDLTARKNESGERPERAVALVLDRSGSMAGDKIIKARSAAKALVARLDDRDRLTLITYASDYALDLPLVTVGGNRDRINHIIDGILDGGGTNLSGGLEQGLKSLRTSGTSGVRRLILVSDGNANQGITDPSVIADIARVARQDGITVSTLGVGLDFNEDLMTGVAQSGGGGYYYAKDGDSIASAFDQELQGLEALAARSVEVGLELPSGVTIEQVYGYRTESRSGRIVIPVGDMASGERRRVMVTLRVSNLSQGPAEITHVVLSDAAPNGGDVEEFQASLAATAIADAAQVAASEQIEVSAAFEAARAARAREEAATAYSTGDRRQAVMRLKQQIAEAKAKNAFLKSPAVESQVREMIQFSDELNAAPPESDQGKDIVKTNKLRARQVFVY